MNRLFIIFCIISCNFSFSQEKSDLFMEKLDIKKQYDPDILKNIKRYNQPKYIDSIKVDKKEVKYNFHEIFEHSFFEKINIKNPPKMSRLYSRTPNNSLLFGMGSQDMFEINFVFNELFEFQEDWGFSMNHYSKNFFVLNNFIKNENSYNNHKYISLDGFSKSDFSFFGQHKISSFEINSIFDVFTQNGLYYGGAEVNQLDSLNEYANLGLDFHFKLFRTNDREGFLNNLEFKYSYLTKRRVRSQNHIYIKSNFSSNLGSVNLNLDLDLNVIGNQLLLKPQFYD